MTTVYLTRHGQTEWNLEKRFQGWGDSPLTELGISQAKSLCERLKDVQIDCIYASPIERAYKTAQIVKGDKNVPLIVHEGLKEMNYGKWEGMTTDEIDKNPEYSSQLFNLFNNPSKYVPIGGETYDVLLERTTHVMDEVIKENEGKSILVVTHGLTLKALLHYFNKDMPLDEFVKIAVMGQASLTQIEIENNEFNIVLKNDTSHYKKPTNTTGW